MSRTKKKEGTVRGKTTVAVMFRELLLILSGENLTSSVFMPVQNFIQFPDIY